MSRLATAFLISIAVATSARAQVEDTVWEDPTLIQAVGDVDVIVRAAVKQVGKDGAVFEVEATFKGRDRKGEDVNVTGLHHPRLAQQPPVAVGDRAYLLLRGDPGGDVFVVPTPSFGRFPLRAFGEETLVVASVGDTFVRLPVQPTWFERFLNAALGGDPDALLTEAKATLDDAEADSSSVYLALSVVAEFGSLRHEESLVALLDQPRFQRDETWRVRMLCARALGRAGSSDAAERLLALVEGDAIGAVRSVAAQACGEALIAGHNQRWSQPLSERLAAVALAELTPQRLVEGSADPIRFARLDDPRTNSLEPLAGAILGSLGRARAREGVPVALRALERHVKPSGVGLDTRELLIAGLAYIETMAEPALVGDVIARMRSPSDDDRIYNQLFARTLEEITGEALGDSREAWQAWWQARGPR